MKDSFSYRSLRPSGGGRNRLLLATLLVISIIGIDALLHGAIRNTMHAGAATLSGWAGYTSNLFPFRNVKNQDSVVRLAQLEDRAAAYDVLKSENEELRTLLNVVGGNSSSTETGITAPIVSSVLSSPYGTFLIGAGSADGIATGNAVLTSSGFVVGIVRDTGLHTSLVKEIFAPGASIEINVHDTPGVAEGFGGGNARVKVPRGLMIIEQDPVLAPGLGQRPVGIVGKVASTSASATEELYVHLPVNLAGLSFVYVIPLDH